MASLLEALSHTIVRILCNVWCQWISVQIKKTMYLFLNAESFQQALQLASEILAGVMPRHPAEFQSEILI